MRTLQSHEASAALRNASLQRQLGPWTSALTGVVVATCESTGWKGAAKGHRSSLLPVPRQEYLALDAVAFEPAGDRRWRFPVAVFKLENSRDDNGVAYSLWKSSAFGQPFGWFSAIAVTPRREPSLSGT